MFAIRGYRPGFGYGKTVLALEAQGAPAESHSIEVELPQEVLDGQVMPI